MSKPIQWVINQPGRPGEPYLQRRAMRDRAKELKAANLPFEVILIFKSNYKRKG